MSSLTICVPACSSALAWVSMRCARATRAWSIAASQVGRAAAAWHGSPAYDHVVQAATGMAWMGGTEGDPPMKTRNPVIVVLGTCRCERRSLVGYGV